MGHSFIKQFVLFTSKFSTIKRRLFEKGRLFYFVADRKGNTKYG